MKTEETHDFSVKPNEHSHIKKVIGVVSGKGGVGKSLVTSLLAAEINRRGHKTAILDADLTGPSIPKAFGINIKAGGDQRGIKPASSSGGIEIMSINLFLEHETDPVVWRGPVLAGTIKQFWTEVVWGEVDFMFIDLPPGTGDVPLTVFQSLPLDGIVIVTSPQQLVSLIVSKAVRMAEMMNIPILGLVENMSFFQCPDCGSRHNIFGESKINEIADKHKLPVLGRLPLDTRLAAACDQGKIEEFSCDWLQEAVEKLTTLEE